MARTARSAFATSRAGTTIAYSAVDATNGEALANDGRTILHVINGGVAPITVTQNWTAAASSQDGITIPPRAVTIANGTDKAMGPFPVALYGTTMNIDYSGGTTVTAAAMKL